VKNRGEMAEVQQISMIFTRLGISHLFPSQLSLLGMGHGQRLRLGGTTWVLYNYGL